MKPRRHRDLSTATAGDPQVTLLLCMGLFCRFWLPGGPQSDYRPVFTLVHSRLITRWVAGSRAVMTNSFASVASSG
ncbi:hypothetical protein ACVWZR_009769 [Bradyrhizobium sp. i1.3.1]